MDDDRPDRIVRVEFRIPDTAAVLDVPTGESRRATLEGIVPHGTDRYAVYFEVEETDPYATLGRVSATGSEDVRLLDSRGNSGLVEIITTGAPAVPALAERGGLPRQENHTGEATSVVADVPPGSDARIVVADFLEEQPDAELVAKSNRSTFTPPERLELRNLIDETLTARQRQVLGLAYRRGYFDSPRRSTGEDLADALDISPSTFLEHLRTAERKLLSILFGEGVVPDGDGDVETGGGASSSWL